MRVGVNQVRHYCRFPIDSKQSQQYTHHSLLGYPRQLGGSVFDAVCMAVDERYVTLGGCTVQRYEALQGGGGCQVFRKKALRNT